MPFQRYTYCDTCGCDHSAEHYRGFSPSVYPELTKIERPFDFFKPKPSGLVHCVSSRGYTSLTISVHMSHYTIMQSNVTPVLYMMYLNAALIPWIEMAQLHNMLGNLHVNEVAHINIAEHIICSFLDNQYLISSLDPIIHHTHITWCYNQYYCGILMVN